MLSWHQFQKLEEDYILEYKSNCLIFGVGVMFPAYMAYDFSGKFYWLSLNVDRYDVEKQD